MRYRSNPDGKVHQQSDFQKPAAKAAGIFAYGRQPSPVTNHFSFVIVKASVIVPVKLPLPVMVTVAVPTFLLLEYLTV